MNLMPHFVEMLNALSDERAEYLVVGGFAMARHGFSRSTGNIDVWVRPSNENCHRVWNALRRFGAPLATTPPEAFMSRDLVYQLGVPPQRIDILTEIEGVEFADAWDDRVAWDVRGRTYPVIGREALLKNKRAVGRPKDLIDAEWLERHAP